MAGVGRSKEYVVTDGVAPPATAGLRLRYGRSALLPYFAPTAVAGAKNVPLARAKRARTNLSRELAELNLGLSAELSETRPLAKLGQRSDEIIHDMGNPLTILTCCVELLQSKVDELRPDQGTQWMETLGYIQMIKKSIQHCCGLADAWRQLRDDISEDRETVGARSFLEEAIDAVQPMSAMNGVALETDFAALNDEAGIDVDATQMRRVVHNLILNAMQACPRDTGRVLVRGVAGGTGLAITVADNGTGISVDRLPMIFEPYYTTKEEGTGLGLAISKRIVEEHSGSISAESEVGRGSIFTVHLPVKVMSAA